MSFERELALVNGSVPSRIFSANMPSALADQNSGINTVLMGKTPEQFEKQVLFACGVQHQELSQLQVGENCPWLHSLESMLGYVIAVEDAGSGKLEDLLYLPGFCTSKLGRMCQSPGPDCLLKDLYTRDHYYQGRIPYFMLALEAQLENNVPFKIFLS